MEFRFKETKNGYAKAEVDAYVMYLNNIVDDIQLKSIGLEKRKVDVDRRAVAIKKAASERAERLIEKASSEYSDITEESFASFKSFTMIRLKINSLIKSTIREIPDSDMASVGQSFSELENEIDLNLKYLNSLMFDLS